MPADSSVDKHGASRRRQPKHHSHALTFLPARHHRGNHTPRARGQASKWESRRRRSNTAGRERTGSRDTHRQPIDAEAALLGPSHLPPGLRPGQSSEGHIRQNPKATYIITAKSEGSHVRVRTRGMGANARRRRVREFSREGWGRTPGGSCARNLTGRMGANTRRVTWSARLQESLHAQAY